MQRVEQAVQDLQHIEVCLNCSSRMLRMVTDIFHYALKVRRLARSDVLGLTDEPRMPVWRVGITVTTVMKRFGFRGADSSPCVPSLVSFASPRQAVLYPLQPLYDRIDKRLKLLCLRALKRIFLMCDTNQDGSLSDLELNTFQQICFNAPLSEEELQSVKQARDFLYIVKSCRAV
jgi:hypothetical protein